MLLIIRSCRNVDLRPVAVFRGLRQLRIVGHRRGLGELLDANRGVRGLALWRLPVDRVLPAITLPHLRSLGLTIGSLADARWLAQLTPVRYLALRVVRGLADVSPVIHLRRWVGWKMRHANNYQSPSEGQ